MIKKLAFKNTMDMPWFEELYRNRIEWVASTRKNRFEKGIRRTAVDKYADPTHFVYELLQNAEDQNATHVWFSLDPSGLIFGHDGTEFTTEDVISITGLGNSDKADQPNKIGRFGIGFKSVFAITDRPEIHTTVEGQPFSFAIEELVVPQMLSERATKPPYSTLFVLPFLSDTRTNLYTAILSKLQSLGADTMLFIDSIEGIVWETDDEGGTYICHRKKVKGVKAVNVHLIEETGTKGGKTRTVEQNYLQFFKRVDIKESDRELTVRLAFQLGDNAIVPEPEGCILNVYFPTEEKTGLKFRLHAPMLLTDNRANVKRHNQINDSLIQACATLLAESLVRLRDTDLMSVSTLACLPIERDRFLGSQWQPLYEAVRKALKTEALLPTDNAKHVEAIKARLAHSSGLHELLSEEQLGKLVGADGPCSWLSSELTEGKFPILWTYLISDIGLKEEDSEPFARKLNRQFLEEQPDEWLVRLYHFLSDVPSLWKSSSRYGSESLLRSNPDKPILRLENGKMVAPYQRGSDAPNAFLPPAYETEFPTVSRKLCEDCKAFEFFQELGLRKPSIVDEVKTGALKRLESYGNMIDFAKCEKDYVQIAEAIRACTSEKLREELQSVLDDCPILVQHAGMPNDLGLTPHWWAFKPTDEVLDWFDGNKNAWVISEKLVTLECWESIRGFLSTKIGWHRKIRPLMIHPFPELRLLKRGSDGNGFVCIRSDHSHHERGLRGFDPDTEIEGMVWALQNPTLRRAVILWNLLLSDPTSISGEVERASRSTFENAAPPIRQYSKLGQLLVDSPWLPDERGSFHAPRELALSDLPDAFERDSARAHEVAENLRMRNSELAEVAQKMGMPVIVAAQVQERYRQDPVGFSAMLERQPRPQFPVHESPDPERRHNKMFESGLEAHDKDYEVRPRSVRIYDSSATEYKRTYLRDLYTDGRGEMICQICQDRMPFRLDNGCHYFEAIDLLPDLKAEMFETCLALCPTCSAKYHHARRTGTDEIVSAIESTNALEIEITLARTSHIVKFVATHLQDIRAALKGYQCRTRPEDY